MAGGRERKLIGGEWSCPNELKGKELRAPIRAGGKKKGKKGIHIKERDKHQWIERMQLTGGSAIYEVTNGGRISATWGSKKGGGRAIITETEGLRGAATVKGME